MKRVFIIHGWEGYPEEGWFPWLKEQLEEKGFEVVVPTMPNTEEPVISEWVAKLKEVAGFVDSETYFVGHSIGCQGILRYLETLPEDAKVGGVVLVGAWMTLDENTLKEEGEACWTMGFPWLAIIYKQLNNPRKYAHYMRKCVNAINDNGELPELYYANSEEHNENSPLGWAQSLFVVANMV